MLGISDEKVAQIIHCAREHDARQDSWKDALESGFGEENVAAPAYNEFAAQNEQSELAEALDELNDDEQAWLVALAWVGRGIFSPEDFGQALEAARADAIPKAGAYLISIPLLADYLEDGLGKLGVTVTEPRDRRLA